MIEGISPSECTTRQATEADAASIMSCTNDAYVADTFFKKAEYHDRFTMQDVIEMIAAPDSIFLLAITTTNQAEIVCGSLYLSWKYPKTDNGEGTDQIIGKFSAVAVHVKYQQRGIGHLLVHAAEDFVISLAKRSNYAIKEAMNSMSLITTESSGTDTGAVITMGVVNLREDLFPWYAKQGYLVVGEIEHDAEISRIVKKEYEHVCLIQMKKVLIPI